MIQKNNINIGHVLSTEHNWANRMWSWSTPNWICRICILQGSIYMVCSKARQHFYVSNVKKEGKKKEVFCGGREGSIKWCIKTKGVSFRSRNIVPRKSEFQVLGCTIHPKVCFSKFSKYSFLLIHYSACKSNSNVLFWGDKGCPSVCSEYKTASERYLVAEL